jgi:putative endonuclease
MKCADNTFYTGITKDIQVRLQQHNKKKVSYTRKRLPVTIIHTEQRGTRSEAAKHERKIKNLGAKKYLIRNFANVNDNFIHL